AQEMISECGLELESGNWNTILRAVIMAFVGVAVSSMWMFIVEAIILLTMVLSARDLMQEYVTRAMNLYAHDKIAPGGVPIVPQNFLRCLWGNLSL
ncbi:17228_t:CDS:2, partial [Acaulospora colombiana]